MNLSLKEIISKIEKEGGYSKKFVYYFSSLKLYYAEPTDSDEVIYPGLK